MTQLEKSALRRKILQQRQSLSPTQWQLKSNLICDRLKSISFFQEAQTILAYFSFRQEPDLSLHHLVVKYLGVRPSIFFLIPKD
jgi:5-formyltetrahydrofolate cyclo-ligase